MNQGKDAIEILLNYKSNMEKESKKQAEAVRKHTGDALNFIKAQMTKLNSEFSKLKEGLRIQPYKDFKAGMSKVFSVSSLVQYNQELEQIGKNLNLVAVRMGMNAKQAGQFYSSVGAIGAATGSNLQDAAQLAETYGNILGKNKDFLKLTTTMAGLANSTGLSHDEAARFAYTLNHIGGIGPKQVARLANGWMELKHSAGLTNQEFSETISSMEEINKQFISFGATPLTMTKVNKATAKLIKEFKKAGIEANKVLGLMKDLFNPDNIEENIGLLSHLGYSMQEVNDIMSGNRAPDDLNVRLQKFSQQVSQMNTFAASSFVKQVTGGKLTLQELQRYSRATATQTVGDMNRVGEGFNRTATQASQNVQRQSQRAANMTAWEGAMEQLKNVARDLLKILNPIIKAVYKIIAEFTKFVTKIVDLFRKVNKETGLFTKIGNFIKKLAETVFKILIKVIEFFKKINFKPFVETFKKIVDKIVSFFKKIWEFISPALKKFGEFVNSMFSKKGAIAIGAVIAGGILLAMFALKKLRRRMASTWTGSAKDFANALKTEAPKIGKTIGDSISKGAKEGIDAIKKSIDEMIPHAKKINQEMKQGDKRAPVKGVKKAARAEVYEMRIVARPDYSGIQEYKKQIAKEGEELHTGFSKWLNKGHQRMLDLYANTGEKLTRRYIRNYALIDNIEGATQKKLQDINNLRDQELAKLAKEYELNQVILKGLDSNSALYKSISASSDEIKRNMEKVGQTALNKEFVTIFSMSSTAAKQLTLELEKEKKSINDIVTEQTKINTTINDMIKLHERNGSLTDEEWKKLEKIGLTTRDINELKVLQVKEESKLLAKQNDLQALANREAILKKQTALEYGVILNDSTKIRDIVNSTNELTEKQKKNIIAISEATAKQIEKDQKLKEYYKNKGGIVVDYDREKALMEQFLKETDKKKKKMIEEELEFQKKANRIASEHQGKIAKKLQNDGKGFWKGLSTTIKSEFQSIAKSAKEIFSLKGLKAFTLGKARESFSKWREYRAQMAGAGSKEERKQIKQKYREEGGGKIMGALKIGGLVAGIAGLGAGLLGMMKSNEGLSAIFESVGDALKTVFDSVISALAPVLTEIAGIFTTLIKTVFSPEFVGILKLVLGKIAGALKEIMPFVKWLVKTLVGSIGWALKIIAKAIGGLVKALMWVIKKVAWLFGGLQSNTAMQELTQQTLEASRIESARIAKSIANLDKTINENNKKFDQIKNMNQALTILNKNQNLNSAELRKNSHFMQLISKSNPELAELMRSDVLSNADMQELMKAQIEIKKMEIAEAAQKRMEEAFKNFQGSVEKIEQLRLQAQKATSESERQKILAQIEKLQAQKIKSDLQMKVFGAQLRRTGETGTMAVGGQAEMDRLQKMRTVANRQAIISQGGGAAEQTIEQQRAGGVNISEGVAIGFKNVARDFQAQFSEAIIKAQNEQGGKPLNAQQMQKLFYEQQEAYRQKIMTPQTDIESLKKQIAEELNKKAKEAEAAGMGRARTVNAGSAEVQQEAAKRLAEQQENARKLEQLFMNFANSMSSSGRMGGFADIQRYANTGQVREDGSSFNRTRDERGSNATGLRINEITANYEKITKELNNANQQAINRMNTNQQATTTQTQAVAANTANTNNNLDNIFKFLKKRMDPDSDEARQAERRPTVARGPSTTTPA